VSPALGLKEQGRACTFAIRTVQAMKHPSLRHLSHNVVFVRVTLAVGWIAMVALLSLLALVLDGRIF
jgi:hypothetical protein